MSSQRKKRQEKQVAQKKPKNFTCGGCKKVVPYGGSLICPECGYGE